MKALLTKMCGAGNDFLIIHKPKDPSLVIKNIAQLCHRKFGIGADGVSILTPQPKGPVLWEFFNSDGSKANMCGNAACCIIDYVYKKKITSKKTFSFQIKNKILEGCLNKKGLAQLKMEKPLFVQKRGSVVIHGKKTFFSHVHSGVPHLLIEENKDFKKLKKTAQDLRKKYPDSNITFYNKKNVQDKKEDAFCVTFERGVEDFTLSCGTGALALAFLLNKGKPCCVRMPGGVLKVFFKNNQAYLISPVYWIADISSFIL